MLSLKTWRKLSYYSADLLVNTVTFVVNLPYSWSFEHTIEWTFNWSKLYRWWEEHHVIMAGFILETFDERPTTRISATSVGWVFVSYNWDAKLSVRHRTGKAVLLQTIANDIGIETFDVSLNRTHINNFRPVILIYCQWNLTPCFETIYMNSLIKSTFGLQK